MYHIFFFFFPFGCAGSFVAVCVAFFSCGAQAAVDHVGSVVVTWAWLPCGMWNLSYLTRNGTWVPVLEGRFSITGPPGKSQHHIFIHSPVHGHLGCFHISVIMNSAPMNIGVHLSFLNYNFSGYIPNEWDCWEHIATLLLLFLRNLHTVLHSGWTSLCSHQQQQNIFERILAITLL